MVSLPERVSVTKTEVLSFKNVESVFDRDIESETKTTFLRSKLSDACESPDLAECGISAAFAFIILDSIINVVAKN
jgi:hypothetical protein